MIRNVRIEHFRALRHVDVELRPLTVLVGPNDSGKSSFVDALYLHLKRSALTADDSWRGETRPNIAVAPVPFEGSVELFRLPAEGVPMQSSGIADAVGIGAPALEENGGNLAAFLDYLLRKDRQRFDLVQDALRKRVEGLDQIHIGTPTPESRAVSVSIESGFESPGHRLSTGVRMLLFFVALAHHPTPPDVALIEEPENGVHPRRLEDIVGLLRSLTAGGPGHKPVQIVLTTHSPYLLDHVRPPEDQILVFRRESDGSRSASAVDATRLATFLDEFMLGEVWFNQGEEGLVAKP